MTSRSLPFGAILKTVWGDPLVKGVDVNHADAVTLHRQIIESKPLLQAAYRRWYRECVPAYEATKHLAGTMIEIGSGAGFLDQVIPGVISTDVVETPFVKKVVNAMELDFPDEDFRAIFLIGVLHHIPFPGKFLAEAQRCLKPGGRLVMVEPSNGFLQRLLGKLTDHYEFFDDTVVEWVNVSAGRMTSANMALPWVIFERDRERFLREFPRLRIVSIRYHTFLAYIVTGGMTYRSFLPTFCVPLVNFTERTFTPLMKHLGTMMTVDLVKTDV